MQITANFRLEEFTRSDVAARRGVRLDPPERIIASIITLVETVLQPLRTELQRPIVITSGFRSAWLNTLIGGARESAHLDGRAADFIVPGMNQANVVKIIRSLALPIDQCISEFPPNGWIHAAIAPCNRQPRDEYLQATVSSVTGQTVYTRME